MTANALKFNNLDYVHEMTDEDWESWHKYQEEQERKEKYAATLTKEQKIEMLYQYQQKGMANLEETNRIKAKKLEKENIPMVEFVNYSIEKEKQ